VQIFFYSSRDPRPRNAKVFPWKTSISCQELALAKARDDTTLGDYAGFVKELTNLYNCEKCELRSNLFPHTNGVKRNFRKGSMRLLRLFQSLAMTVEVEDGGGRIRRRYEEIAARLTQLKKKGTHDIFCQSTLSLL